MVIDLFSAKFMLDQFGRDISLKIKTDGSYDIITGTITPSYTTKTIRAYSYMNRNNSNDASTDYSTRSMILNALDTSGNSYTAPKTYDRVIDNSRELEVVEVHPVYSGSTTIFYLIKVKV